MVPLTHSHRCGGISWWRFCTHRCASRSHNTSATADGPSVECSVVGVHTTTSLLAHLLVHPSQDLDHLRMDHISTWDLTPK